MSFDVDTNKQDHPSYPGDYRAWTNFVTKVGHSIWRNIDLTEIIHLQPPRNSNRFIQGWGNPSDQKSFQFATQL